MTSLRGRFLSFLTFLSLISVSFAPATSAAVASRWHEFEVASPNGLKGVYRYAGEIASKPLVYKANEGKQDAGYNLEQEGKDYFFREKSSGRRIKIALKKAIQFSFAPTGHPEALAPVSSHAVPDFGWKTVVVKDAKGVPQALHYNGNGGVLDAASGETRFPLFAAPGAGAGAAGKGAPVALLAQKGGKNAGILDLGGARSSAYTLGGERDAAAGAPVLADPAKVDGGAVGPETDKSNPVNQLAALMKGQPEARGEIARRLFRFVKEPPEGRSFFSPQLKATVEKDAEAAKKLSAFVRGWVDKNHGDAAEVYFWLCTAEPAREECAAASGVLNGRRSESLNIAAFERDLASCLARWSTSDASVQERCGVLPVKARKPLGGDKQAEWFDAFLADAVEHTRSLLKAERADIGKILGEIRKNDETGGGIAIDPKAKAPLKGVDLSKPFGVKELFGAWGDYNVVHIDGRRIAVVIRTTKAGDNPPNKFAQEVGIYDISEAEAGNVYGRRFALDYESAKPFTLNGKDDGKQYTLKFEPSKNGKDITVNLQGAVEGTKTVYGQGGQTEITLNRLFQDRAEKVKTYGNLVDVGGKRYYAFGEAADRGSLTFWSEDMVNRRGEYAGLDARRLAPEMVAYVNRRSSSGAPENLADKVSLGKVGEQWYDLVWNERLRMWVPAKGSEPPKEQPKADAKPGESPAGAAPGQDGVQVDADGWPVLADPPYKVYKKLDEKLDAGLRKSSARFIEDTGMDDPLKRVTINLKASTPKKTLACFVLMPFANGLVRRVPAGEDVLAGHIVRVKALYDDGVMTRYSDLAGSYDCGNLDAYGPAHYLGDQVAGKFDLNMRDWTTQAPALSDALSDPEVGLKDKVPAIVTNIDKARGDNKAFKVAGNKDAVVLLIGGKERCKVYPKYEPCGTVDIGGKDKDELRTGMALEVAGADWNTQDVELPGTTTPAGSEQDAVKIASSADGTAALYELKGEDKKAKYYVLFKVKGAEGNVRVGKPILISEDPDFLKTKPELPGLLHLLDLQAKEKKYLPVLGTAGLRFAVIPKYADGLKSKGAWALYSGSSNEKANKYKNLHGCFITWGGAECKP